MFRVGLEPTIPVFKRPKALRASDRTATVNGVFVSCRSLICIHQVSIATCRGVTIDDMDWILGVLTTYTGHSEIHVIRALSQTYTFYSSTLHTHTRVINLQLYPGNRFQHSNYTSIIVTAAHMKYFLHSLTPFLPSLLSHLRLPSQETHSILSQVSLSLSLILRPTFSHSVSQSVLE
jgi:hypothetical protein